LDDVSSVPRSFNIVDQGNRELGLPGYPRAPPLPTSRGKVVGVTELMCSQVATVHQLLKETLTVVGRDVLQPVRVSPKI
jgi:hypothetical protein